MRLQLTATWPIDTFLLTVGLSFGNNTPMITNSYFSFAGFSFWCGFFFRPSTRGKGLFQE
jgi:hypothetical protein